MSDPRQNFVHYSNYKMLGYFPLATWHGYLTSETLPFYMNEKININTPLRNAIRMSCYADMRLLWNALFCSVPNVVRRHWDPYPYG